MEYSGFEPALQWFDQPVRTSRYNGVLVRQVVMAASTTRADSPVYPPRRSTATSDESAFIRRDFIVSERPARVLDVGNCDPDHGLISGMLTGNFDVRVDRVMFVKDALARMRSVAYDLVLFNRLIFEDGSEGIDLLHAAKSDKALKSTPIMMISNFADAQMKAVEAGAEPGFGKAAATSPETIVRLSKYLPGVGGS